ncbi:hypothetical protein MXB_1040, partial [Myxobolus squamalis]
MTYDRAISCFVPCIFAYFSRKGKKLYLHLFHKIIVMLDWVWESEAIVCDFEQAL